MEKRLIFLMLVMLLLLTACTSDASASTLEPVAVAAEGTPFIVLPSPSPLATQTPTRIMTPTTDYAARIGEEQLALQRSLGSATVAAVTEQSVIKTSTAIQSSLDATGTATVAAGFRKMTATVAVTQTREAQAVQTSSAAATGTTQAPITQRAQVDADWAPYWQLLFFFGALLLVLLVLYFAAQIGYQLLRAAYEKRLALYAQSQPVAAAPETPLDVKLDSRDAYGWGSVDFATLPIDRETLRDVAELLTNGARYTQAQMTGAGRPLVKDGTYNTFGEWMCKYAVAVKVDRQYTITHPEFFRQVLTG